MRRRYYLALAVVAGTRTKHRSSDPGGFVIRRRKLAGSTLLAALGVRLVLRGFE